MTESTEQIKVFYDGACPLCTREISFYRRRSGSDSIAWVDVSDGDENRLPSGLTQEQALARFHVLDAEGRLVSGGVAFARLWEALPGFRPLGRLFRSRALSWMLDRLYDLFLKTRPSLQAVMARREKRDEAALPRWLLRELRSDHAGETGAVYIYRGILAVSRNPAVRSFAAAHLATERRHLALMEDALPPRARSIFLPLWRVAGFLTGALPALFGQRAVFATIDAVETFVDRHYGAQVERMSRDGTNPSLRDLLERCRLDEVDHRDEARDALDRPPGAMLRLWCWTVGAGSAAAVSLARLT